VKGSGFFYFSGVYFQCDWYEIKDRYRRGGPAPKWYRLEIHVGFGDGLLPALLMLHQQVSPKRQLFCLKFFLKGIWHVAFRIRQQEARL